MDVFEADAVPGTNAGTCSFDPLQEPWIGLQPVLGPILFLLEPNQHAGCSTVTGNDNFLLFGLA